MGYVVMYRTGGTALFQWRKIFTFFPNMIDAEVKMSELWRMGYPAIVEYAESVEAAVLPTTFYLE
jgi:hypothetical protein